MILSGVNEHVHRVLTKSGFDKKIGAENICNINEAVEKAKAAYKTKILSDRGDWIFIPVNNTSPLVRQLPLFYGWKPRPPRPRPYNPRNTKHVIRGNQRLTLPSFRYTSIMRAIIINNSFTVYK